MNTVSLTLIQGSNPTQTTSQSVQYNDHVLSIGNKPTLEQPLQNHNKQKTLLEYSVFVVHAPITTALG